MSRYIEINDKVFIFVGMSHNTILETQELISQNKKIKSKFNKIKKEYAKTHYNNSYFLVFVEANCGIKNAEIWWEIVGKYKLNVNISEDLFKKYQEKTKTTGNELKDVSLNTEKLNISLINIIRKNNKWKYNKSIFPCDENILNKVKEN